MGSYNPAYQRDQKCLHEKTDNWNDGVKTPRFGVKQLHKKGGSAAEAKK